MSGAALEDPQVSAGRPAHGGVEEVLGVRRLRSDKDLVQLVEQQLSTRVLRSLHKHGLEDSEVYELVIPRRTLSHRRARRQRLSRDESDRAVRVARILALARQVFGEPEQALHWLRKPRRHFEDQNPLQLLRTEAGARLVEEMLYQIDEGIFA